MNKRVLNVCVATIAVALFGFGCSSTTPPPPVHTSQSTGGISNPQPLSLVGLDPKDAARKIMFVGGNSIEIHESFTGPGKALAAALGYGTSVDRSVVINKYSPDVSAEMEWKATTQIASPTKNDPRHFTQKQYVGSITDSGLRSSYSLYPPMYWRHTKSSALGTSSLWLSQDVYEDLEKTYLGTMKFGVEDGELLGFASSTPQLRQTIRDLQSGINRVIDRTDVFLATSTIATQDLKVNGTTSTVRVINVRSWFGKMSVLDNPENPLVLSVTLGRPAGIDFGGFFDYKITELRDLQQ